MKTRVIILGAPGSGKGTQAEKLAKKLNLPHIDTGSMLREEIASGSEEGKLIDKLISKGNLAPVELVVKTIKNRIAKPDAQEGYVLDGFPRSLEQAEAFDRIFIEINEQIDCVLNICLDENVLIDRMAYRKSCKNCGAKYNTKFNPPGEDGKCRICGGELEQRADDNVETAKKRINIYKEQTEPVIEHYKNKGIVYNIDGNKAIDQIFKEILETLNVKF